MVPLATIAPGIVLADFRRLVELSRRRLPKTRVAFVSVKPSPSRLRLIPDQAEANCLVRRFARWHLKVDFLDVASVLLGDRGEPDSTLHAVDRLHLNAADNDRWAVVLGPYLERWK